MEGDPPGTHRAADEGAAQLWGEHYFVTSFVPQDLCEVTTHKNSDLGLDPAPKKLINILAVKIE